jgi:hypothetical protein
MSRSPARIRPTTPVAGDVGQELQCVVTASYSVVPISAPSISQQVTVLHSSSGSGTTTTNPAPKLTLITCKRAKVTVARHHKKARVRRDLCTSKLVAASTKLKAARADHTATLTRHRRTFASGYARTTKAGVQASLIASRSLPRGSYTLNVVSPRGRKQTISHQPVTIT